MIVAKELIGDLFIKKDPETREVFAGEIVETEAYRGDDPACHAWGIFKRKLSQETIKQMALKKKSAFLYSKPGRAYGYLNYGVHWLFNIVTEPEFSAGAVLLRAIRPLHGLDFMANNRGFKGELSEKNKINLCNGPGKLTQAYGINGESHQIHIGLENSTIQIFRPRKKNLDVSTDGRIGISKATDFPWRFLKKDCSYVSRKLSNFKAREALK